MTSTLRTPTARTIARIVSMVLAISMLCSCAASAKKKQADLAGRAGTATGGKSGLRDATITLDQLEELSNAFADRYYTLITSASEKVMRDNPSLEQRRMMNAVRLLGVSSMYDIASSPDTFTQLIDQLIVVTLQNYYWVDSGKSQKIWGERAQPFVENLRRAREDIWACAARIFTEDQLEQLDLIISTWWQKNGGAEFVAYVRFADIASAKGIALIEEVKDGGGLLEPIDRATEQIAQTQRALDRSLFYAKRVPLFINWQLEAFVFDILIMPEVRQALSDTNKVSGVIGDIPNLLNQNSEVASKLLSQYKDSITSTISLVDKIAPIATSAERIAKEAGTTVGLVNTTLTTASQMQESAAKSAPNNAAPSKPIDLAEYASLLNQVQSNLTEANKFLSTTDKLLDEKDLELRLKPLESLIRLRISEVQLATEDVVNGIFIRAGILLFVIFAFIVAIIWWRSHRRS